MDTEPLAFQALTTMLKAAGEATRLRILALIAEAELTVSDLTEILRQSQPRLSRHLRLLAEAGLVERFREGSWAFFRLRERGSAADIARAMITRLDADDPVIARDRERLAAVRTARATAAQNYFRRHAAEWDRIRKLHVADTAVEDAIRGALADKPIRSLLDLVNNFCVVVALRHVTLPLFYILVFMAPLVITLLAATFLYEKIGLGRVIAAIAGFAGVVIAVNPFSASRQGDWIGFLACMVCVACFSVNMVWSRVLTRTETPESLAFFSGIVMIAAGSACMLVHAQPVSGPWLLALLAMGVFCAAGSLCFFAALKHTTASTVSQYHYTQLLTGSLADYLIPTASDFPKIRGFVMESHPSPINPLGAKGAGEGGIISVGGVIANAVADALSSLGVEPRDLPLSPSRVWQLVQDARN